MYKYIPIVKGKLSFETLVDFSKERNLRKTFSPLLEIGRTISDTDIKFIKDLQKSFDHLFLDYYFLKHTREKKPWNVNPHNDIFQYLGELSEKKNIQIESDAFKKTVTPVISERPSIDGEFEPIDTLKRTLIRGREKGFKSVALRFNYWFKEGISQDIIDLTKNLGEDDFVLLDSRTTSLKKKDSIPEYDKRLKYDITKIQDSKPGINLILLNSKFTIRLDSGEDVEHLHWPVLKDKLDIFGYGDYQTEQRREGGGNGKLFGIYLPFYDYDNRNFLMFHQPTDKELLIHLRNHKTVRGEIDRHKGYCRYCKKLSDSIERNELDEELKNRKGELGRIHQLNSISVNEMNTPQPSPS